MPPLSAAALRAEAGRILRFGAVGLVATAAHMAVTVASVNVLDAPATTANGAGFAVALALGWAGHHFFSFASARPLATTAFGYAAVALAGLAASTGALHALSGFEALSDTARVLLAAAIVPPISFLLSRLFVF